MAIKILFSSIAFGAFALLASVLPLAHAASVFDITYPIPELGNCADRLACKAYCDESANEQACEAFAQHYGLTIAPQQPAQSQGQPQGGGQNNAQQQAIQQAIAQDGGPGKCGVGAKDPESACRDYCNLSAHIEECVQYGESHGILAGSQLEQAQKVAVALQNGVPLPSGCANAQSCQESCQNPQTLDQAKSCFAFAKAAGILPPGFDEAKAEKVFAAIQNGTAPFSSMQDFQQCQHPTDPAVIKKCTDFAVQSGFMTQQQADTLQQTGGKGPGGCQGQDECQQYCASHQNECFQFAQEHNLITPEQQDQMKQAAQQMQQALSNAPDAVRQCIIAAVGQQTLDAITAGTMPGSPQIGQAMQQCFEKNLPNGQNGPMNGGPYGPPPQPGQNGPGGPNQPPGPDNYENFGSSTPPFGHYGSSTPPGGPQGMYMPSPNGPYGEDMGSSSQPGEFYGPPNYNPQGQQFYGPPNGQNQNGQFMPPQNGQGEPNDIMGPNGFNQQYQQGQPSYPQPQFMGGPQGGGPNGPGPNGFQNYGSSTPPGGPQGGYGQPNFMPPQPPQGSSTPPGGFPPPPAGTPPPQPTSMNGFLSQVAAVVLSLFRR